MKKTIFVLAVILISTSVFAATATVTKTITPRIGTPTATCTVTPTPVPTLNDNEISYWKGVLNPIVALSIPKSIGEIKETYTKTDIEIIVYKKPVAIKTAVATLVPKPEKIISEVEVKEK